MSAIPTLLADAVTAVLNAAVAAESLSSLTTAEMDALTIRRSYPDWDDDFKDLKTLAVDVVFVSSGSNGGDMFELDSAAALGSDLAVDVAVRYRFAPTDRETDGRLKNTSVDKYVHLVDEIHQKLAGSRATALSITGLSANWLDASVRTYVDYRRLREGVFLGVVRVRYNVSKVA